MQNLGYYNGKIGLIEEMMIPMNDRACYFGDGVYDATCCKNGVIYLLEEHIDRFFNSAGLMRINLGYTKAELADILNTYMRPYTDAVPAEELGVIELQNTTSVLNDEGAQMDDYT